MFCLLKQIMFLELCVNIQAQLCNHNKRLWEVEWPEALASPGLCMLVIWCVLILPHLSLKYFMSRCSFSFLCGDLVCLRVV